MLSILLAIASCCCNVVFLEILIKAVPGCGNVVTFFQFLFIACEGFIFTCKFGSVKPTVPIRNYLVLVVMYFAVSVSNNCALNFNIPMPLHMIFKSGSLVTSMLLGMLLLKRRYSILKYISVFIVSLGIFIATWASHQLKANKDNPKGFETFSFGDRSLIGIFLLTFSLLLSAGLGIYQETIFKYYGKHPREALFYSHMLALPGFVMLAGEIRALTPLFSQSENVPLLPGLTVSYLWFCLMMNALTQYICVRSVFTIAAKYSSLTVTMIITCRKFISLVFSIIYFENPFTLTHWLGTFLVFAGTLLFTDVFSFDKPRLKKDS